MEHPRPTDRATHRQAAPTLRETFILVGPEIRPPPEAVMPGRWIAGYCMQLMHWRSPLLGECVACGSPDEHCPAWHAGEATMRSALAGPTDPPEQPNP